MKNKKGLSIYWIPVALYLAIALTYLNFILDTFMEITGMSLTGLWIFRLVATYTQLFVIIYILFKVFYKEVEDKKDIESTEKSARETL